LQKTENNAKEKNRRRVQIAVPIIENA